MDLGKTPSDSDLISIRTSRQSFTGQVGIGSTAQKALDDQFCKGFTYIYHGQASLFYQWHTL